MLCYLSAAVASGVDAWALKVLCRVPNALVCGGTEPLGACLWTLRVWFLSMCALVISDYHPLPIWKNLGLMIMRDASARVICLKILSFVPTEECYIQSFWGVLPRLQHKSQTLKEGGKQTNKPKKSKKASKQTNKQIASNMLIACWHHRRGGARLHTLNCMHVPVSFISFQRTPGLQAQSLRRNSGHEILLFSLSSKWQYTQLTQAGRHWVFSFNDIAIYCNAMMSPYLIAVPHDNSDTELHFLMCKERQHTFNSSI